MKNNPNIIIYIFAGLLLLNLLYLWGKSRFSESLIPGEPAPSFDLAIVNGKLGERKRLEGLKGRVVILDFWSTSCPACLKGLSILKKLYSKYHQRGVEIIGVNVEGAKESFIRDFSHSFDIRFPLAIDRDLKLAERYKVNSLPFTFIIDKNGIIRYTHQGLYPYNVYEEEIKLLLNE